MENLSKLINDVLDIFKTEEFSKLLGEYVGENNNECCKKDSCCDDKVKSYGYYDKKVYKNNELYDHIEKKYEDGQCYSVKHEPNHGVCCNAEEKKAVEHKYKKECDEHKCEKECKCENNKNYEEEISNLKEKYDELLKTHNELKETANELIETLRVYHKENEELKDKLNNIKKLF